MPPIELEHGVSDSGPLERRSLGENLRGIEHIVALAQHEMEIRGGQTAARRAGRIDVRWEKAGP